MKTKKYYTILGLLLIAFGTVLTSSTIVADKKRNTVIEVVKTNVNGKGIDLHIEFLTGKSHNHPTMAVWVEDMNENYIQTLYVTQSLATGVFNHGEEEQNKWKHEPGEVRRPATLPYYLHKRNVKASDGTFLPTVDAPVPDAYSGATPVSAFNLQSKTDEVLSGKFRLLFEVNQPWDWNGYWHNSLYPNDFNYKTSCQPALVYAVTINTEQKGDYYLNPIGHSHYSGANGELYTDLSSLTTALDIFKTIIVTLK